MEDLFEHRRREQLRREAPLAARMRPASLDEFVGQQHFLGEGKLLWRMLRAKRLGSLIFYGPPGTGKTTLAAAFISLERDVVIADCDVDASNLHLVLDPQVMETQEFTGLKVAVKDKEECTECGECLEKCPQNIEIPDWLKKVHAELYMENPPGPPRPPQRKEEPERSG